MMFEEVLREVKRWKWFKRSFDTLPRSSLRYSKLKFVSMGEFVFCTTREKKTGRVERVNFIFF